MDAWWTVQQGGMVGAIGGGAMGMAGALVGSLSFLVARGKAKPLMVGIFVGMLLVGLALIVAGVIAVTSSQPRHVWYPLILSGGVGTAVFGGLLPVILARYRNAEARRMEAAQLRRS